MHKFHSLTIFQNLSAKPHQVLTQVPFIAVPAVVAVAASVATVAIAAAAESVPSTPLWLGQAPQQLHQTQHSPAAWTVAVLAVAAAPAS